MNVTLDKLLELNIRAYEEYRAWNSFERVSVDPYRAFRLQRLLKAAKDRYERKQAKMEIISKSKIFHHRDFLTAEDFK